MRVVVQDKEETVRPKYSVFLLRPQIGSSFHAEEQIIQRSDDYSFKHFKKNVPTPQDLEFDT
jgi:hypothetical protein